MTDKRHRPDLTTPPYPHWMPTIEAICERHGVAWREVLAGYHDRRVAACRHDIWAELYANFDSSFATIGRRTGGYDRSTVRSGVRRFQAARLND